jgi:hypothetical protein
MLIGGVSGWGVVVAGRVPAHVYRIDRFDAHGRRAALVRVSDGAPYSAHVDLLRLVPLVEVRP